MEIQILLAVLFCAIVCSALLWEFRDDFPQDVNKKADLVPRFLFLGGGAFLLSSIQGLSFQGVVMWFISACLLFWPVFDETMNVRLGRPFADSRSSPSKIDRLLSNWPKIMIQIGLLIIWCGMLILKSLISAVLFAPAALPLALISKSTRATARAYWIPVMTGQAVICFMCGKVAVDMSPGYDVSDWPTGTGWLPIVYVSLLILPLVILIWKKKK